MSLSATAALEGRIAATFGAAHAVLFGRARSALAALLDVLLVHARYEALIPSNVCPALLTTVWASGAKVRALPIDAGTGLVPDAILAHEIERAESGIAIATQLYGRRQAHPLSAAAAAMRPGWFLLENDTLATSALGLDSHVPPFAQASLISFGYAKTIEAGGGGALVTDDGALTRELRKRAQQFAPLDDAALAAENAEMHERRRLRAGIGSDPGLAQQLMITAMSELRYGFDNRLAEPLAAALSDLRETIARRRDREHAWERRLAPLRSAIEEIPMPTVAPWRLIRRLPKRRDAVAARLRAAGFDAGTNFPPLSDSYPGLLASNDSASRWGAEVLNLWLSDDYDDARIADAVDTIAMALERS